MPDQLESYKTSLTALHRLRDRWSVLTKASVGDFSTDGFGVGLFALASYQFSETFSAGAAPFSF